MKIAIPTNDRETIAKRTGRALEFAFYTIENGKIISVTYSENIHKHGEHDRSEGHHHEKNEEHGHDDILEILIDIDILLVRAIGKYMRKSLQKGNINYKIVKIDAISELLKGYL